MSPNRRLPDPAAGALLSDDMADLLVPGVVVEVDAAEAESLGAFEETALTEAVAWDANADLQPARHDDYVGQVASTIIQQLKQAAAPWQQPRGPGERFMPYNPTTGNDYRGMNVVWLMSQSQARGFTDTRWMTYRQSQEQGARVREGEEGTQVQFWTWQGLEPVPDANGQPVWQMVRYERPRVMAAVVFNAEQIDGLPPAPVREVRPEDTAAPRKPGHAMRHPFGSQDQAREELRAEITSLMLGAQRGIGHDPSQHALHGARWIEALEHDPRELFRAAADAETIVTLVRSHAPDREQQYSQTQDAGIKQEDAMPSPSGPAIRPPTMIRDTSPAAQAPSPERTYLAVPYAEKDDAKQLGAKWDGAEKAWYVPAGMDLEAFTPWLPAKGSVHIAVDANPVEQFAEALRDSGLQLGGSPQMDGRLHRVRAEGDRGAERSGAYRGHLDGRPAGFIQNHRTGVKQTWKASGPAAALDARDRAQMAAEAAQKRHDRAHEREQQAERVAQQVDAIWTAATPVQAHPYLADKGVQSHGLRQDDAGRLLVPVQDAEGRIWSVQKIGADGFKQFQEGGRVVGGHFVIGDLRQPGPILIAEGYATAATLHEMTDMPAIVAFNAGNLLPVAQTYRGLNPDRVIYIAGDDDRQRSAELDAQGRPKVNVGRVKAEEAAAAIGAQAVFPDFAPGANGTDWNDLNRMQGRPHAAEMLHQSIAIADREQAVQILAVTREEPHHKSSQETGHAVDRAGRTSNREPTLVQVLDHGNER